MKVVLKEISVSRLFLWICIIHYAQLYKSSHALFYDIVIYCKIKIKKFLQLTTSHIEEVINNK